MTSDMKLLFLKGKICRPTLFSAPISVGGFLPTRKKKEVYGNPKTAIAIYGRKIMARSLCCIHLAFCIVVSLTLHYKTFRVSINAHNRGFYFYNIRKSVLKDKYSTHLLFLFLTLIIQSTAPNRTSWSLKHDFKVVWLMSLW